eukprot:CAMPEP_0114599246 /NCGR_PEP_ID=MMETSP0125-20121206/21746_1 /TAXON_ID=485358 ORGANISM="Aristerostoma sp., Strain ATCC 50986" /NCGR_SAMPLE_ID=MMETSP0125 /ASSEMBLY_ACC=CAM_ASM_000245 /LENGTH=68 /DNA_ID=CAMNT_0001806045 /DNA_START=30 /DNA_END=236 /DNA_ORIENTATION=+
MKAKEAKELEWHSKEVNPVSKEELDYEHIPTKISEGCIQYFPLTEATEDVQHAIDIQLLRLGLKTGDY